jgi:hypothetical protein
MEGKPAERKKICPRCKSVFSCFDENCWCSKLPPVMPLSENSECLCPACLEKEIEKKVRLK